MTVCTIRTDVAWLTALTETTTLTTNGVGNIDTLQKSGDILWWSSTCPLLCLLQLTTYRSHHCTSNLRTCAEKCVSIEKCIEHVQSMFCTEDWAWHANNFLTSDQSRTAVCTCFQPHKPANPGRPIVALNGSSTRNISRSVCHLLSETSYTGTLSHIWNTMNFLNKPQKLPPLSTVHHIEMDLHVKPTDTRQHLQIISCCPRTQQIHVSGLVPLVSK